MKNILKVMGCVAVGVMLMTVFSCKWNKSVKVKEDLKLKLQPTAKTAVLEEDGYFVWGASPIKGKDGLYHIFYSRWKKKYGFQAWASHSEITHAVSKNLFGPYKYKDVALPVRGEEFWDGTTTHNPTIHKWGNKYYLYYMGNTGDREYGKGLNFVHRNNQRVGVAVSDDLNGPWKRFDKPLIDVSPDSTASDALCTTNPAVTQMPNGKFLLIYKCVGKKRPLPFGGPVVHMSAISDSPTGPFKKIEKELDAFSHCEDPFIWTQNNKVYAILHGRFSGIVEDSVILFESENGIDWKPAKNALITKRVIKWDDGTEQKVNKMERPQLYIEKGIPKALFNAVSDFGGFTNTYFDSKGFTNTYNIQTPLEVSFE